VISVTPEGSISPTQVLPPLVVRRATAPCPPATAHRARGTGDGLDPADAPEPGHFCPGNWPRHFSGRQGRLVGRQARSPRSTPGRRQPLEPNGGPARRRGSARRAVRGAVRCLGQFHPSLAGPGKGIRCGGGVATVSGSCRPRRRGALSERGGSGRCFVTPRLVPVPVEMDDRCR